MARTKKSLSLRDKRTVESYYKQRPDRSSVMYTPRNNSFEATQAQYDGYIEY